MGTLEDVMDILGLGTQEPTSYGVLRPEEEEDYSNEISTYVAPDYVEQWSDVVDTAINENQSSLGFNLDSKFVKRIIQQESGGDQYAQSYAGAMGLMQLMPETAEAMGVYDPFNAEENIRGGVKFLSQLMDKYDGDKKKVLAAYNGGESGVDQAVEKYGDKWLNHLDEFKGIDEYTGQNHAVQTWNYIDSIENDIPMSGISSTLDDVMEILGIEETAEEPLAPAQMAEVPVEAPPVEEKPKEKLSFREQRDIVHEEIMERGEFLNEAAERFKKFGKEIPEWADVKKMEKDDKFAYNYYQQMKSLEGGTAFLSGAAGALVPFSGGLKTGIQKKAEAEKPVAATTGKITGTVGAAMLGGTAISKAISKIPAIAKSPVLSATLSRMVTSGAISAGQQDWKDNFVESLKNVAESAGAGAVSILPEIAIPAEGKKILLQAIAQPLADVVYNAAIGKLRGRSAEETTKQTILDAALGLGFSIIDIKSGDVFRAGQIEQRAEIGNWVKNKGKKGFKIEVSEENVQETIKNLREFEAKQEVAKQPEAQPPTTTKIPVIEKEAEFDVVQKGGLEIGKAKRPQPTETELAELPPETPVKPVEEGEPTPIPEGVETYVREKEPYTPKPEEEIETTRFGEELERLRKEQEAETASYETKKQKLETEKESVEFAREFRKSFAEEMDVKDYTSDEWAYLTGKKTRDAEGNLIIRSEETTKKLQKIADAWNLAKEEGPGATRQMVPPERVLNTVDNWTPDDVQDVLSTATTGKEYRTWKRDYQSRLDEMESQREQYYEETGKRQEELEARLGTSEFNERIAKTAGTVDEFVEEFAIPVGFATKDISKVKQVNDEVKLTGSVNPEAEARYKEAHGIKQPSVMSKIRKAVSNIKKSFTRHYPSLDPKTDGAQIDILRQHEAVPEYSKLAATNVIRGITAGFGPKKMDIFERNIIYPDILRTIDEGLYNGKKLPLGYENREEIQIDYDNYKKKAEENPDIKNAIDVRNKFYDVFKKELVENNLLNKDVLEDKAYFHRQVLEHIAMKDFKGTGTTAGDVRTHRKGWQRSRIGSENDFNTSYLESEYEVLSQGISQIETAKTLRRIRETSDITDYLKEQAKKINAKKGVEILEGGTEKKVDYKELIPDDYTLWQPKQGNIFYQANSLSDKVINEILEGSARIQRIAGTGRVKAEKIRLLQESDIKKIAAIGGKKQQWIIPKRLAETLDNFQTFKPNDVVGKFSKEAMNTWKQWTLLNPFRVFKYNLNNMSGDLDIALAYNPKIMGNMYGAAKDLANYNLAKKPPSKEILSAVRKGVIGSGFTGREIPDISKSGFFKAITGENPNIIKKGWKNIKDFTEYRENILRLAAYRHFKSELEAGKLVYGASKKSEVDAITDIDDKAAKLARELIGDYGNISKAGQWIRSHIMPFYSWLEINSPRYLKLIQNLPHEGKPGGKIGRAAGGVAWKAGKLTAKAATLSVMINLWNHTFFPDEEKELGEARRQLHLILGRDDEGNVRSIRFQGALSDVLNWVGAEDIHYDIGDIISGKKTIAEKGKEAAAAFGSKIFNALGPQFKLPVELATGRATYPDITKPRPIRSKGEHVAKTFSVDLPYKVMTGKPIRGVKDELMASVVYKTDPGENAYYDIKKKTYDYLAKTGKETGGYKPSNKSNALYYYKKAVMYKDNKAASRWWKRYEELGGNKRKMKNSIKYSSPLGSLSRREQAAFLKTLTTDEQEKLDKAKEWFGKLFY